MADLSRLSILVFSEKPNEFLLRHTGLYIRYTDGSFPRFVHIVGPAGEYRFDVRGEDYEPLKRGKFDAEIHVASIRETPDTLVGVLSTVLMRNNHPEFNCHLWVDMGLDRLKALGYISPETYEDATGRMVEVLMEADDMRF